MSVVTINQLAKRLNANPHMIRGLVAGLGIQTTKAGWAYLVTEKDAEKVRRRLEAFRLQTGKEEPAAETAAP